MLLLDNLSNDGTAAAARREDGLIEVIDWPLTGQDYQIRAYEFAVAHLAGAFDWIAFFDTDEFLVLDEVGGLKSLLEARAGAAALAVAWAMFGSSGHYMRPEGLVVDMYPHRAPPSFFPNRHVKSIIRAAAFRRCQNPHIAVVDGDYQDLAGRPVAWQMPGVLAAEPDWRGGKLHHYFTRSLADWIEKLSRGYHDTKRTPQEFFNYDRNEVFDDSAARTRHRLVRGMTPWTSTK